MIRPISPEGIRIPIRGAYTGIKGVPLIGVARNFFASEFMLFEDHTETRVILLRNAPISEIEWIDVKNFLGKRSLQINWKNSLLNFSARMDTIQEDVILAEVIRFFESKGVALGAAAQNFINAETRITLDKLHHNEQK